ncbi:hypothetical protein EB796_008535 [Bugula neritina]|uniref:Uncharacterized protein n=1 Tax=Bugula neritina TaxID=10212 RepID=A0A7J7K4R7_BUGNE|nr:hypothetical protein EB796_014550 [Bugula neritina]KAF6033163.1 hypothetical protein EB796_008535 [Bugula neritina]
MIKLIEPEDSQCQEATGACCLQLVTSSEVLLKQCQLCSSMCDDIDSEHLADTVQRMSQLSKKISRLIIQFMQALLSNIDKVVHQYVLSCTATATATLKRIFMVLLTESSTKCNPF